MPTYKFRADVTITVVAENIAQARKQAAKVKLVGTGSGCHKPRNNRDWIRYTSEAAISPPKLLRTARSAAKEGSSDE